MNEINQLSTRVARSQSDSRCFTRIGILTVCSLDLKPPARRIAATVFFVYFAELRLLLFAVKATATKTNSLWLTLTSARCSKEPCPWEGGIYILNTL